MQKDFEDRLLSLLNSPETLSEVQTQGVSVDSFVVRKEIFEFITKYRNKYNTVPPRNILEANFPDFKVISDVGSDEKRYLIEELSKAEVKRKAIRILDTGADLLESDTYGAIDLIVSKLSAARGENKKFSRSYTDKDALKRLQQFKERKAKLQKGLQVGLKTGLSIFDDKKFGWQPGNLIAIIGRPSMGKTWVLEYIACAAYKNGSRVLFISPEMSNQEIELRWDTIMATMYGKSIPNEALTLGKVNEKDYEEWLVQASGRGDWLTIDSDTGKSFTPASIQSAVDDFAPDIVCVDGFLLLDSQSRGEKSWEVMKNIAAALKSIAQNNKVVMVVASQAGRESASNMPQLHQVYGGDSLVQFADVVLTLSDNPDEANTRFISVPKRRGGRGHSKPIKISFEVDKGIIGI